MNYSYSQPASAHADVSRRVLRRTIRLAFQDALHFHGKTLDVSLSGLTLMSPLQITRGKICDIVFDIPMDGRMRKVSALSKAHDSICVGTEGFRTGLKFIHIDSSSRMAINDLMRYGT